MWLIFKKKQKEKKKLADWAVFLRVYVCYSLCLFTKNLSLILSISLCWFHNLIHTHKHETHTCTRTRASAYQLTQWWIHNYERVCQEKLISKHKFIAINLSIAMAIAPLTHALHTYYSVHNKFSYCQFILCVSELFSAREENKHGGYDKWGWL